MADLIIQAGIDGLDGLTEVDGNMPEISSKGLKFHLSRDIHTEGYFPYRTMVRIAHLTNPANGQGFEVKLGVEHWIGFAVYLEGPWEPDNLAGLIFQVKGIPDRHLDEQKSPLNPILPIRLKHDYIDTISRGDSRQVTVKPYEHENLYALGDYAVDEWIYFVVRYFPSYESDGLLEILLNDKAIVGQKGPNCFNDRRGPALDFGIYKPHWRTGSTGGNDDIRERTLYIKNIRIAIGEDGHSLVDPSRENSLPGHSHEEILKRLGAAEERLEVVEAQIVELTEGFSDILSATTELQMALARLKSEVFNLQSTQLAQDSTIENILTTFRELRDLLQNWV